MKHGFAVIVAVLAAFIILPSVTHAQFSSKQTLVWTKGLRLDKGNMRVIADTTLDTVTVAATTTIPSGFVVVGLGTGKCTRITPLTTSDAGRLIYWYHNTTDTLVNGVNLKLGADVPGVAGKVTQLIWMMRGLAADTFFTKVN